MLSFKWLWPNSPNFSKISAYLLCKRTIDGHFFGSDKLYQQRKYIFLSGLPLFTADRTLYKTWYRWQKDSSLGSCIETCHIRNGLTLIRITVRAHLVFLISQADASRLEIWSPSAYRWDARRAGSLWWTVCKGKAPCGPLAVKRDGQSCFSSQ